MKSLENLQNFEDGVGTAGWLLTPEHLVVLSYEALGFLQA